MLRHAVRLNSCTELAITKLDVLAPLDELKVCVAYEGEDGTRYEHVPYHQSVLHKVRPVYETLPGWKHEIDTAARLDDLPARGARLRRVRAGRRGRADQLPRGRSVSRADRRAPRRGRRFTRVRVLVIGGGGREHALAWGLARARPSTRSSPRRAVPGPRRSRGTCRSTRRTRRRSRALADELDADLVVVGPEEPLVRGVVDAVQAAWSPRLRPDERRCAPRGLEAVDEGAPGRRRRADGRARVVRGRRGGCGVRLPRHARRPLRREDRRARGGEGRRRDRVARRGRRRRCGATCRATRSATPVARSSSKRGCGGRSSRCSWCATAIRTARVPLAPAQDFKRIGDDDAGPNTGGMGAYSPVPIVDDEMVEQVMLTVGAADAAHAARRGSRVPRRPLRRDHAHRRRPEGARVQRALR